MMDYLNDNKGLIKECEDLKMQLENEKKTFMNLLSNEKKQNLELLEEKEKLKEDMKLLENELIEKKNLMQQFLKRREALMNLLRTTKEEQEKLKEENSNLKQQIERLNCIKEVSRQEHQQLKKEKTPGSSLTPVRKNPVPSVTPARKTPGPSMTMRKTPGPPGFTRFYITPITNTKSVPRPSISTPSASSIKKTASGVRISANQRSAQSSTPSSIKSFKRPASPDIVVEKEIRLGRKGVKISMIPDNKTTGTANLPSSTKI